ncbi:MAG: sporulation integral membrane protein YtvI [Clostridiales bacterium]|nr:sporulation integral membrane protein YtvI [Clostridiales bacterium]
MVRLSARTRIILKWLGLVLLLAGLLLLFFTRLFKYIAPFIIAFIIMVSIEKPIQFLQKKLKMTRGSAAAISLALFVVLIGGALGFIFSRIIIELWKLALELSRMDFNPIIDYFKSLVEKGQDIFSSLPRGLAAAIEESVEIDASKLTKIANEISIRLMDIVMGTVRFIRFLPNALVFVIITLISAYFMCRDREGISKFFTKHIPPDWYAKLQSLRNDMLVALAGFIKAQMFIMLVTFLELWIGYQIMGVKYALFFALLTAIVDILPILGTGAILIPTFIIYFIIGNIPKALGFMFLYIFIFIVRQILEPKVVSHNLGLHPLLTIMAMYIGLKFMGIPGVFLGPAIAIVIKAFHKAGFFPAWKM